MALYGDTMAKEDIATQRSIFTAVYTHSQVGIDRAIFLPRDDMP